MLSRAQFFLGFTMFIALVAPVPALAQVEPTATGDAGGALDDSEMMTPPPVSGMPYPNAAGSDARSNYLATSVTFSPAYIDNVLPGSGAAPISAESYSILPSVSLDHSAPREKVQFAYSPSFTFYEPITNLDSIDHNASVAFQYRFNPEVSFSVQDNFTRTSNVYDSTFLLGNSISGSSLAAAPTIIAPFAEELVNSANGALSYQFGRNAMIGGGGSSTTFDLPNPTSAEGLYSSNGGGGEVFYNRRLSRSQYFGLAYQYYLVVTHPPSGVNETQTHTLLPFYTIYFNRTFSISASAGIQRLDSSQTGSPDSNSWSPSVTASVGWQGHRGNLAASFSHTVTAEEGLLGAYNSNNVSASGGWKLARTWSGEFSIGYFSINSATPAASSSVPDGNTLTATATLQHSIGERWNASFQYQHLRENYNIAVINADPDSNRVSATITYQFRKALGR
jgi:hypothetical protein